MENIHDNSISKMYDLEHMLCSQDQVELLLDSCKTIERCFHDTEEQDDTTEQIQLLLPSFVVKNWHDWFTILSHADDGTFLEKQRILLQRQSLEQFLGIFKSLNYLHCKRGKVMQMLTAVAAELLMQQGQQKFIKTAWLKEYLAGLPLKISQKIGTKIMHHYQNIKKDILSNIAIEDAGILAQKKYVFEHDQIRSLAFSGDSKRLATTSYEKISVWDIKTKSLINTFKGTGAICLSNDGMWLAAGAYKAQQGNYIEIFNVHTGERIKSFDCPHVINITALAISADKKLLAVGFERGGVCLWDIQTGRLEKQLPMDMSISHVAISSGNDKIYICRSPVMFDYHGLLNYHGMMQIIDLHSDQCIYNSYKAEL